jgi:hypothetical protein
VGGAVSGAGVDGVAATVRECWVPGCGVGVGFGLAGDVTGWLIDGVIDGRAVWLWLCCCGGFEEVLVAGTDELTLSVAVEV